MNAKLNINLLSFYIDYFVEKEGILAQNKTNIPYV